MGYTRHPNDFNVIPPKTTLVRGAPCMEVRAVKMKTHYPQNKRRDANPTRKMNNR